MANKLYSNGSEFSPNVNVNTIGSDKGSLKLSDNYWFGKNVCYLGDSITYGTGTTTTFREYLKTWLGTGNVSYAVAGHKFSDLYNQAKSAIADSNNYDAIVIWCGTNDFNENIPLGVWYTEADASVSKNGVITTLKRKTMSTDTTTMRGNINQLMSLLKANYPKAKIIVMTPIHRGYAKFSSANEQPDESYANTLGLYINDYVEAIKEVGDLWSVSVIDLFSESGLYPLIDEYTQYYNSATSDRLHLNADGHKVIAKLLANKLQSISCPMID